MAILPCSFDTSCFVGLCFSILLSVKDFMLASLVTKLDRCLHVNVFRYYINYKLMKKKVSSSRVRKIVVGF